jgi:hypothetical protein
VPGACKNVTRSVGCIDFRNSVIEPEILLLWDELPPSRKAQDAAVLCVSRCHLWLKALLFPITRDDGAFRQFLRPPVATRSFHFSHFGSSRDFFFEQKRFFLPHPTYNHLLESQGKEHSNGNKSRTKPGWRPPSE